MSAPLPERLRAKTLSEYVGQGHIIGPGKLIDQLIVSHKKTSFFPSLILWGPPGVGKTTLARILAKECGREIIEMSATNTSVAQIHKVVKDAEGGNIPFLFIDEIHRFSKSQQDKLLPYVEKGAITFIGATTENPSFEVIRPLLSRTRVLVLKELENEDLQIILKKALKEVNKKIDDEAREFLLTASNGDARILLNVIEIASHLTSEKTLNTRDIEQGLQKKMLGFDREGDEHYNVISAFIKSMRASQTDAALYYLARMVEAGQDPLYIARRMVIFASEDIGMAQPTALVVANGVFRACEVIGYPECAINLSHGVIYLSEAKKDRRVYDGLQLALNDVRTLGNLPVPLKVRNAPTKLMKELDYGKGYEKYDTESYLPEKIKNKIYFKK